VFFYVAMTLISGSLVGCCIFLMNQLCDSLAAGVVIKAIDCDHDGDPNDAPGLECPAQSFAF
jgi:hypothetical protein